MSSSIQSSFCRLKMPQPLEVLVRGDEYGPPLGREPVRVADLAEAVAETWRDQCLRGGYPQQALSDIPITLLPDFSAEGSARCKGFELEIELPNGEKSRQKFNLKCLRPAAIRAAEALVSAGILSDGQKFCYELAVVAELPVAPDAEDLRFTVKANSPSPTALRVSLRPLLRAAKAVDMYDEEAFPVFFTAEALSRAEACSHQGALSVPPVESGGVLIGSLAWCQVTREFFAIVTDVLEANDAEQSTFSLAYSGQSWTRIQAILKARQTAYPAQAVRLLGQCHGHNFLPNDGNRCDQCEKRAVCSLSSVFVSSDDETWMRAVFARQPWALCLIFGLSARKEPVHQLYSLKGGTWQPRGYFLLPEFKPDFSHAVDQTSKSL